MLYFHKIGNNLLDSQENLSILACVNGRMQIYNTNTIPNLYNPIFRIFKTNNSKTVTKLKLQNLKIQTIPIPI